MPICRCYLIATLLFLNGCAGIQPKINLPPVNTSEHQQHLIALKNIKSFALKGRLGVVTQQKGFSGSVEWQHVGNVDLASSTDNVEVFSPLGGKVAHIAKNSNGVTLTSQDGRTATAPDVESLTDNALGFKLPLSGLSDWVLGRPATSQIDLLTVDDLGRILTLKQEGWDISFENYSQVNAVFLPNKVILKSEKVNLKLIIDSWIDTKQ